MVSCVLGLRFLLFCSIHITCTFKIVKLLFVSVFYKFVDSCCAVQFWLLNVFLSCFFDSQMIKSFVLIYISCSFEVPSNFCLHLVGKVPIYSTMAT